MCPGKKFGQVEFVAVMAALFRTHRVEPVPDRGESMESARVRTMAVVNDSSMRLLLQMAKPERVGLRWISQEPRTCAHSGVSRRVEKPAHHVDA